MLDLLKIQFEEEEWLKENKIYEKLLAKDGKKFYFLDGPPYLNDVPHIGHLKIKIIKDVIIRLKFMQDYKVFFMPGFDTHGLPIENAVEKKLNLKNKKEIEELGVSKFLEICKKSVMLNKDLWLQIYKNAGLLYFLKQPYLTYENYYIESAWWTFKRWWERGLVYKGYKPIHYCNHCQTSLAGYEITDSYITLKDPSIYVLFKLKEKINNKEAYILVWTTTPWTLVSNVALAIRDDTDYALVELSDGRNVLIAQDRIDVLTQIGYGYNIIDKIKGKDLVGLSYYPVLDLPIQKQLEEMKKENQKIHTLIPSIKLLKERVASKTAAKKAIKVKELFEDFVNLSEGTGVVHTAGGHGKTDYEISQYYNLPIISPLDDECKFTSDAGWLKGIYVKDADLKIIDYLEKNNSLLYFEYIDHKYPVCWRCKTPLIVKLNEQYFVSIKPIKEKMLKEIEKVKWLPEFSKERMINWVVNAEDWNISRQRYWGIPIPIWECENKNCKEVKVISSLKQLGEEAIKANNPIPIDFDLHSASDVELLCDVCGSKMKRVPYVFDVWFDSSIAPWASLGYPYYDNNLFENLWPVDRISEGQDQIRGWFYVLLFSGVATFNISPYKCVSMVGWILDAKGQKMSKSLGNVIYAKDAIEKYGADLLRFYLLYDSPPYTVQLVNLDNIYKEPMKFFNVLYNLYNFYSQLGPAEKFNEEIEDRWILSKVNKLIKEYTQYLENFEFNLALRNLYDFVLNDFSRTYIKLIREKAENKKLLIKEILKIILKLLYPVSPFFSDWLWRKIENGSLVLEKWPKYKEDKINENLEKNFDLINKIIEIALAIRTENKINLRWPLRNLFIFSDENINIEDFVEILKSQTNVKNIIVDKVKNITKEAKKLDNIWVDLSKDMDDELFAEGLAREISRNIQDSRKKLKLVRENIIELELVLDTNMKELLLKYNWIKFIKERVNAKIFDILEKESKKKFEFEKEFMIKDKKIKIRINKLS
ncbi:MAG: isoleucine--tRNA ligase [Candidatus Pacearchaeota archaeon]